MLTLNIISHTLTHHHLRFIEYLNPSSEEPSSSELGSLNSLFHCFSCVALHETHNALSLSLVITEIGIRLVFALLAHRVFIRLN